MQYRTSRFNRDLEKTNYFSPFKQDEMEAVDGRWIFVRGNLVLNPLSQEASAWPTPFSSAVRMTL